MQTKKKKCFLSKHEVISGSNKKKLIMLAKRLADII